MSKRSKGTRGTAADKHCLFPGCIQTKPIKGSNWNKHRATHFKDGKPSLAIQGKDFEVCIGEQSCQTCAEN